MPGSRSFATSTECLGKNITSGTMEETGSKAKDQKCSSEDRTADNHAVLITHSVFRYSHVKIENTKLKLKRYPSFQREEMKMKASQKVLEDNDISPFGV